MFAFCQNDPSTDLHVAPPKLEGEIVADPLQVVTMHLDHTDDSDSIYYSNKFLSVHLPRLFGIPYMSASVKVNQLSWRRWMEEWAMSLMERGTQSLLIYLIFPSFYLVRYKIEIITPLAGLWWEVNEMINLIRQLLWLAQLGAQLIIWWSLVFKIFTIDTAMKLVYIVCVFARCL